MKNITFITGPAGSGKSYKLRELIENETRTKLICAPTGIAATAVSGSTLHRTFGIDPSRGVARKTWNNIDVVYIDEASMMGMTTFKAVLEAAPNADFVLVGDMAQLPPVKDHFWFGLPQLKDYTVNIERLTTQFRQYNDMDFAEVMNDIRVGEADSKQMRWLYSQSTLEEENEGATVLAYRNDTVRAINSEAIMKMKGESQTFNAIYWGVMREQDCIADPELTLKVGARVIMLNNDPMDRWSNGTMATVIEIDAYTGIQIDGQEYAVEPHLWKMKLPVELTEYRRKEIKMILNVMELTSEQRQEYSDALASGIEYVISGTCKQYPMKLAYAMTVHKAQGMTLDRIKIISSGFAGCHGIGYVALSRARSIDDVTFTRPPKLADFRINMELLKWL